MPWCPKCKAEYVAGKTVCIDCGTELVDDIEAAPEKVAFMETEKEKLADKFVQFLHYSKIDSAVCEYDEEKKKWVVFVNEAVLKQVTKLYQAFYSVETTQQLTELEKASTSYESSSDESDELTEYDEFTDADITDADYESDLTDTDESGEFDDSMFDKEELQEILKNSTKTPQKTATYVKKEVQYSDLQSSAVTFIVISVLGIIFLILNIIGTIHIMNGLLSYLVMGGLFIIFFMIGISSLASAKRVKAQVGEENSLTDSINNWLYQNVTVEQLNSLTQGEDNDEIRFFNKLEKMKELIITQFGELDESYLDNLVEEYYNSHFESIES